MSDISELERQALHAVEQATDLDAVEALRVEYLGKSGVITAQLRGLGKLTPEQKKTAGAQINRVKQTLQSALTDKTDAIKAHILEQKLKSECIDVTLPGRASYQGSLHPVTRTLNRITDYFAHLGFEVAQGPEIENDYYNFEALNIPESHPSRQMHDTFYFPDGSLLRTHTSPVQVRYMKDKGAPIRMIAPGRVYRCDSDLTHTPMFHQVEALMIGDDISFSDLKGILSDFLHYFFEQDMPVRFRPAYFPFTEPSAEVDIQCVQCHGEGCRVCGGTGWLEVLGSGMVHPSVLDNVGIDSEKHIGFAFGLGVDRFAMLRYGINDIRLFFENDLRFLKQF